MARLSSNVQESIFCVENSHTVSTGNVHARAREYNSCVDLQLRLLQCVTAELDRWSSPNLAAPYWRLYVMNGPGAEVRLKGRTVALDANHAWLIPPDTAFGAQLKRPTTQCYVHFTLSAGIVGTPGVYAVPLAPDLRRWHKRAMAAKTSASGGIAWHMLVLQALDRLPTEVMSERRVDPQVQRVLAHIERDPAANHTLASLAKVAGMHAGTLIRLCRQETGNTPMASLRALRISLACEMLHHGDRTIDDISTAVGFCDRYHFTKTFRQLREITPAAFRSSRHGTSAKERRTL
jgi:AraC-like DNA-binding protein